jgi:6-pyruvoyltetrahydropterin/6-carboxytetrahydropterin synthase
VLVEKQNLSYFMSAYKVRVTKDNLIFCSGHFATFDGQAEPLHGHNYRVAAVLEGVLDENHWVFDFVTLKKTLKAICDKLDHRMLLPTDNPLITIERSANSFTVHTGQKMYVFPQEDVVQLTIPNTTAEQFARWIAEQLEAVLVERGAKNVTAIEIEVEETFGQAGFYRKEIGR